MILKYENLKDIDKLEIKDIVEDMTCRTCRKYALYINTNFKCPESDMVEVHGKKICRNWELDKKKFKKENKNVGKSNRE